MKIYIRAEVKNRLVHECIKQLWDVNCEVEQLNETYSKYGDLYKLYIAPLCVLGDKRIEEDYAAFCILCDREGLKPFVFFDWLHFHLSPNSKPDDVAHSNVRQATVIG